MKTQNKTNETKKYCPLQVRSLSVVFAKKKTKKKLETKKQSRLVIYLDILELLDLYILYNAQFISVALSNLQKTGLGFCTNSIRISYHIETSANEVGLLTPAERALPKKYDLLHFLIT